MEGRNASWRDAHEDLRASYFDLPPGDFRFRMRVRSQFGTWHEVGETLALHLEPFFYQRPAFRITCALAALALILGVHAYRLRLQRRILRLEHEARWTQERERISRDVHDDLGANLSRIALLGEVARKQVQAGNTVGPSIDEMTRIAGQSIDDMGELIWANNPRYDSWDSLLACLREHANRTFADTGIQCVAAILEKIPSTPIPGEWRRHVFLLVKETLNNALKHSEATLVELHITTDPSHVVVRVRDNGLGFDPSKVPAFHHGLDHVRQRVQLLGGTLNLKTHPDQGTEIQYTLPFP